MTTISKRTWTGVANEAVSYTAAAAPTLYVPTKSTFKNLQPNVYQSEDRGTVDEDYTSVPGVRIANADIKGDFYPDYDAYELWLMMGALPTTTQPDNVNCPTVYKHTGNFADIPITQTWFKNYDTEVYYMAGVALEKFSFSWNADGKLLERDAALKGLYMQQYTGSALTPAYVTGTRPFPGYAPAISINGVKSQIIPEFKFDYSRKIEPFYPSNGFPDFTRWDCGARKVTVEFTARFDDTSIITLFSSKTNFALSFDVQGDLIASHSGTSYYKELNVSMPIIVIDSAEWDTGKNSVMLKVKGTALAGSTPNSLFSLYVQNTITSYVS